jgi:flagellar biosynthetic protein FliP
MRRVLAALTTFVVVTSVALVLQMAPAFAQVTTPTTTQPAAQVNLDLGGTGAGSVPSQSVVIILLLTLLGVAPALLIMLTSFTRVVVVLSLTRNALGLQSIPPNQVVVGLALFLSLFLMAPTLTKMNDDALQPYLKGTKTQAVAFADAQKPLKTFMLGQVRSKELAMFVNASGERPARPQDVSMTALIPAFILSELKTAFIIGFIVFVPFLVIDLVVSSSLMSMGMMMLPPVLISLPFKLLLFVMVDGWALVVRSLLASFN